jgi:ubiquinone/menaquinone biosynthesis C-methylase UbiE
LKIPDRLLWAVDELAPDPADDVLEIGCGTGVAAELILQRLTTGTLTAIDRSAAMIRAAEKRNHAYVQQGKARLLQVSLEDARFEGVRFDKALAVHVNRFWLKPRDESALWASLLKPGGLVCLVYQPFPGASPQPVADACSEYFHKSGFSDIQVRTAERRPAPLVCIRATWPTGRSR